MRGLAKVFTILMTLIQADAVHAGERPNIVLINTDGKDAQDQGNTIRGRDAGNLHTCGGPRYPGSP